MTATLNPVGAEGILGFYRVVLDSYPQVDPHEFATAYVNHVAKTGKKPPVWDAIDYFYTFGKVAA